MRELRPLSAVLPLSLLLWSWTSVAYAETNGYRVFWPDGAGPHPAIAFLSGCSGFAPVGARKFYERVAETLGQEGYVVLFMEYVGRRGLQSCASAPMVSEDAAKDHSPLPDDVREPEGQHLSAPHAGVQCGDDQQRLHTGRCSEGS